MTEDEVIQKMSRNDLFRLGVICGIETAFSSPGMSEEEVVDLAERRMDEIENE